MTDKVERVCEMEIKNIFGEGKLEITTILDKWDFILPRLFILIRVFSIDYNEK